MSLYRCSACGSPNVVTGSENAGFSYSKGIAGAIVFGAPGAVAGINGKTKQVFKCPDCGLTMDSPMANEIKVMIDLGLMSETARNNLTLNGVKIDWSTLTGRYKNIEKGYVDEQLAEKEAKKQMSIADDKRILEQKATATQKEFDEAIDILYDIKSKFGCFKKDDRIYNKENPITKDEFENSVNAIFTVVENLYKFFPPSSYDNGTKYRQFSIYFDSIFNEYVVLYYFKLTGMPFIVTDDSTKFLLESNQFIGAFLRTFYSENSGRKLWGWSVFDSGTILFCGTSIFSNIFIIDCDKKDVSDIWGKYQPLISDIFDIRQIYLPSFAIIEDKLSFWDASFGGTKSLNNIINQYFNAHPDKKVEFIDFIKSTEQLFERYESLETELKLIPSKRKETENQIQYLNNKNTSINSQISENDFEIERLSRKIFFKNKANEQISYLRSSNDKLHKELHINNESIKTLNQKIEDNKETYWAFRKMIDKLKQELITDTLQQLFTKMNNFIDWTTVE